MRRPASLCYALGKMDEKNKLYFGDNLKILRDYVEDASVDLIYLDPACAGRPPFNSSATYNVLFKEKSGEESAAQIMAFEASVAPLYERRLLPEEQPAVIDRRYSIMDAKNKLYFGDNLKILREYVPDASVDLIYLDPACPPRRACGRQAAVQLQRHLQRALQGKERRGIRCPDHVL